MVPPSHPPSHAIPLPAHERSTPAKQRARRQSPCTHANGSPECVPAPPNVTHSRAEPKEPRRGAGAPRTRTAPFTSRAEHQEPRSAPGKIGHFRPSGGTHTAPLRKDDMSPRANRYEPCRTHHKRASPAQEHARRQSPCTHARRSVSLPRPTPRTAAPSPRSRAEAQEPHRRAPHLRRAAPDV